MATFSEKRALTYDDVVIRPRYSDIDSRNSIDTSTKIGKIKLKLPVISSNMDTVTADTMCEVMFENGGLGILHRFADENVTKGWIDSLLEKGIVFGASVGVNREDDYLIKWMISKNVPLICIDVAHGHHEKVERRIKYIKSFNYTGVIMAGNVCTYEGALFLAEAGAHAIRVGIGPGSICSTRVSTGCGMPQLTAIIESSKIKSEHPNVSIIADGGIKSPGDVCKALAGGADAVMIGSLLAGTKASPGNIISIGSFEKPKLVKSYRGSASMSCKVDAGMEARYVEGVSTFVPYRGKVESVLGPIGDGLRSGMSYVGARNLTQLMDSAVFEENNAQWTPRRYHA